MYIAHYKSVSSTKEFYSKPNANLDFPTQISKDRERYLLTETYIAATPSQIKNINTRAEELGILFDVSVF